MKSCCKTKKAKKCKRKDGKIFDLPRKFSRKKCKHVRGFTMRSSCAPYKFCGGAKTKKCRKKLSAIAVLEKNKFNISGVVYFKEKNNGLRINYDIQGLRDGHHGFHIHESGNILHGCDSACAHFNPFGKNHGGLHSKERHAGDLGNIVSKNNISKGSLFAKDLSLKASNITSVLGRMILIHQDKDDLGKGENDESKKTGNAGKRLACGIIAVH